MAPERSTSRAAPRTADGPGWGQREPNDAANRPTDVYGECSMRAHTLQTRIIPARYASTCSACGCAVSVGSLIAWTPGNSKVSHADVGNCGRSYTVRVTYTSTSKELRVNALSAEAAYQHAAVRCDPVAKLEGQLQAARVAKMTALTSADKTAAVIRLHQLVWKLGQARCSAEIKLARPVAYAVYQGNVLVSREAVK